MEIFDLMDLAAEGYENRQVNVFYQNDFFKTRVIVLEVGGKIPECQMDTYVMFYVVKGEVLIKKNDETSVLKENQGEHAKIKDNLLRWKEQETDPEIGGRGAC